MAEHEWEFPAYAPYAFLTMELIQRRVYPDTLLVFHRMPLDKEFKLFESSRRTTTVQKDEGPKGVCVVAPVL